MKHALFQDLVPYDVPTSLNALHGPACGWLELPHSVHWGPDRWVDLDQTADQVSMYQAVVREGSAAQQEALLNAGLLRRLWRELALPIRCRDAWEAAFADLRHAVGDEASLMGPHG